MAPEGSALRLHPSRVVRFLGNELPDPALGLSAWSDSVLQTLYDAVHAVALTTTGATSLMHEAKVDVVTVPNLSEHLSSAETTQQLSARFSYAAAMKSLNNLLLLGDGETWSRQKIDFSGLPEMVRTFLQVAAGMSATGDSDTRNYYDMVSARQELDLRPQLERLDNLILRSAGVDPAALSFEFRPLWQMDAAASAQIALQKAQVSRIYAGLNLWPAAVTARLAEAQLIEDGTYPGTEAIFAEVASPVSQPTADFNFNPAELRNRLGQWTSGGGAASSFSPVSVSGDPLQPAEAVPAHASTSHSWPNLAISKAASPDRPNGLLSALDPEQGSQSLVGSAFSDSISKESWVKSSIVTAQAAEPLLPGGVLREPLQGTDPLDPANLNTSAPSVHEQLALVAALNLIQSGATAKLNPHAYQNRPDPKTGAIRPLSAEGYTTYDVPSGSLNRGPKRVILDNATREVYYTNTHYRSFFYIIISKR